VYPKHQRVVGNVARERRGEFQPEKAREVDTLPTHWSVPVILLTLRRCNSHGYELMKQGAKFGLAPMNPGTWYRTLRRMEEEGIIESRWETSGGGAARRTYSITDAGEAYLDFWAEALKQYRLAMDAFLRLYGRGGATSGREESRPIGKLTVAGTDLG
jgi:PadR family transcriptional regulator, regulatory protein PadR